MKVEVAGVGIHPFGRHDGITNTDMGVHAVRAALAEAGDPETWRNSDDADSRQYVPEPAMRQRDDRPEER